MPKYHDHDISDVVFVFLLDLGHDRLGIHGHALLARDRENDVVDDDVGYQVIVEVVDELFVELLRDDVLVEVFLVELGLVLELVVAHRAGALWERKKGGLAANRGNCEMLPDRAFRTRVGPWGRGV